MMHIRNTIVFSFFLHTFFLTAALVSAKYIVSAERIFVVELRDDRAAEPAKAGNDIPEAKKEIKKGVVKNPPGKDRRIVSFQPTAKGAERTPGEDAADVRVEQILDRDAKGENAFSGEGVTMRSGSGEGGLPSASGPDGAARQGMSSAITVELHGSGGGDQGLLRQIKEAIERAKVYPDLARKRRQEGTVVMEFLINSRGIPEDIRITKSSSFDLLDSAAKRTIVRAAPFPVVKGRIEVPITFVLK